jgi:hypothetical protein
MAKKTKKTVKAKKAGTKRKQTMAKSAVKKKVAKKPAKAKKSSAAKTKRAVVKASKPKRKSVASRKVPVASAVVRSPKSAKPMPEVTNQQANTPHPGMMGDGTEEQNLNQQGNPAERISQDDVDEAFKKPD